MRLSAAVDFDNGMDWIEYNYDIATDTHFVSIWDGLQNITRAGSAGQMINVLAPYRYLDEIQTLVAWLSR